MTEFFTAPKLNDAYTETLKNIKQQHQKIMVLYKNLKKRTEIRSNKTKYQIQCEFKSINGQISHKIGRRNLDVRCHWCIFTYLT